MTLEIHAIPEPAAIRQALAARKSGIDEQIRNTFQKFLAASCPSGLAIVAVGGYGRGELFPHSDIDLLFLVESDAHIPPKERIQVFLQSLWDSNLHPSHSVHTVAECVAEHAENAEFTISLLDHRMLAGDETLYAGMKQKFAQFRTRRGPSVAKKLVELAESRRAKFHNSIYHLEPNIKETPGGFRDLQTLHWLHALDPHGTPPDLTTAFYFLSGIRQRLHDLASRDQNVLSFDAQDMLSEHPATLMREYFRHARAVDQATRLALEATMVRGGGSLLGRFHEWRSRLSTADYTVLRERVLLRGQKPPTDLSLFEFIARHDLRLAADTMERMQGFVPQANWDNWKRLLSLPKPSPGLRAMQECGVLGRALPEWQNIECLVVRDFYHRYTVDEHTLVALENLENIADARFANLAAGVGDLTLLRFALILHDIGKGSGRDHSTVGEEIAHAVLGRLGAPQEDIDTVAYLVRHHLALSNVMSTRDLFDGATARALADSIGTVERLKLLTLLTYADISAVNPQAMSPWRLEQLWQAYVSAHQEFTRELATERIHYSELAKEPVGTSPEMAQFLEGLPTRYARTHSKAEIEGHSQMADQLASRPVAIEVVQDHGAHKLTLLTKDRPGLFASVAGTISSFGLDIVRAEAFSNSSGVVVDSFVFTDPHRTLELNPSETERLRGVVRKVVEGTEDAERLLRGRQRTFRASRMKIKPSVSFKDEEGINATLVEISTADRPALLHDLAAAISVAGCNIEVVMIDTEAHRAQDVFYVTREGSKLTEEIEIKLQAQLLAACVGSSN
ncbi:MAG: HD domain-containing protein [Acidobacteriota bacterium]